MSARDLGAEIAASFSSVAEAATAFVEECYSSAQSTLREFNARWELRANISRRQTVIEQIAKRLVRQHLLNVQGLIAWLRAESLPESNLTPIFESVGQSLMVWDQDLDREASVAGRDAVVGSSDAFVSLLIKARRLFSEAATTINSLRSKIASLPPDVDRRIDQLGAWFDASALGYGAPDTPAIRNAVQREKDLGRQLNQSADEGRLVAERLTCLEEMSELLRHWSVEHDSLCPVCDSDVTGRGGIRTITSSLIDSLRSDLEAKRAQYKRLQSERIAATNTLAELGVPQGDLQHATDRNSWPYLFPRFRMRTH